MHSPTKNNISYPLLTSILDNDAYKFHMQQAIFHRYWDVTVSAEFFCRENEPLGKYSPVISSQVEMMYDLKLNNDELNYFHNLPFFKSDYLSWLRQFRYNPSQVKICNNHGNLNIRINGLWYEVILWEVPLLAIISEIVYKRRFPQISSEQAIQQLKRKLKHFNYTSRDVDISNFRLVDFGTRRRFSRQVQLDIIKEMQHNFSYIIGTSNYQIAKELNLSPIGTQAHEWFQAHQQISTNLASSQRVALQAWLDEYPDKLNIALTDCITMDAFLRDFSIYFAKAYKGLRHDSGDPIKWGEKAIAHYQKYNINPMDKTLIFSDNLDLSKALMLYRHFHRRIKLIFGIGTHLTCDIPCIKPLNIVIKLVECNEKPVAKLSDSPGKTICHDKSFIYALKKAFNLPLAIKKAS